MIVRHMLALLRTCLAWTWRLMLSASGLLVIKAHHFSGATFEWLVAYAIWPCVMMLVVATLPEAAPRTRALVQGPGMCRAL